MTHNEFKLPEDLLRPLAKFLREAQIETQLSEHTLQVRFEFLDGN